MQFGYAKRIELEPDLAASQPSWYYRLVYRNPSVNQLKKSTLEFCGVKPVKVTYIGIIKTADHHKSAMWINQVYKLGSNINKLKSFAPKKMIKLLPKATNWGLSLQ